jgi:hypothetical protein
LIIVVRQQAGSRATAVKPVCALDFLWFFLLCKQKKERKVKKMKYRSGTQTDSSLRSE